MSLLHPEAALVPLVKDMCGQGCLIQKNGFRKLQHGSDAASKHLHPRIFPAKMHSVKEVSGCSFPGRPFSAESDRFRETRYNDFENVYKGE
jgi:hypothetical protein